jgi:hypothetical protein
MSAIPQTFSAVLETLFNYRIDLAGLMPILDAPPKFGPRALGGVQQLIYEAERLNPNLPILMRYCEKDATLASGAQIKVKDWVVAMVSVANLDEDPNAFPEHLRLSLFPYLPGPPRVEDNYLMFGATGSGKECWGRPRVAMTVLTECVRAAARLQNLRRVAGSGGQTNKLLDAVAIGLPARFSGVGPPP